MLPMPSTEVPNLRARDLKRSRFRALCQSLHPDLLRFATWLTRDRSIAEDVVQESLLRAWRAQDAIRDERSTKPWLLSIVRREYARTFERTKYMMVSLDDLVAQEEPELAQDDQHEILELRATIERLPHKYREPLILKVQMGYSTAEIADKLNLPIPTVLTHLFRARNQLRSLCGTETQLEAQSE
jgi:RNA polymerase sigma-70 factor, ECF subfamily